MALKFHMGGRTLSGKIACACCSWILLSLATKFSAAAQTNVVVVRPKPIHNVLVNPGMGITTFQRFNGQELNPPLKRSGRTSDETAASGHEAGIPRGVCFLLPLVLERSRTGAREVSLGDCGPCFRGG